jgi:hypothetical protein
MCSADLQVCKRAGLKSCATTRAAHDTTINAEHAEHADTLPAARFATPIFVFAASMGRSATNAQAGLKACTATTRDDSSLTRVDS